MYTGFVVGSVLIESLKLQSHPGHTIVAKDDSYEENNRSERLLPLTVIRKYFHLLAVLLFFPIALLDVSMLGIAILPCMC